MQIDNIVGPILALPRSAKRIIALLVDSAICVLSVWLAFFLRLGDFVPLTGNALWAAIASIFLALPIFVATGLYRAIFRYSGLPALTAVVRAIGIYGILYAALFTAVSLPNVPRTIGIIQPLLLCIFIGGSRLLARFWLGGHYNNILRWSSRPKVLIYGASRFGHQLALALANSPEMQVVGFLDDDPMLHRKLLNGVPVHSLASLEGLVETHDIGHVLLAMPNLPRIRRNEIISRLRGRRVAVRTLPNLADLARGRVAVSDLQELDIDDLLGREPIAPDPVLLAKNVAGKTVLVTGAGGSIGSELCRQIMAIGPARLLLVELSEFALYNIHQELEQKYSGMGIEVVPLLASITDPIRIERIMETFCPQTVYHAAAYKHVPIVEHNPSEGIRNNVFGTLCLAKAAREAGVSDFVLISTDKAVRPTNIMGASKRLAEMVLQAFAQSCKTTTFSMVRFGNVLGSSGSVVPKFRQQIREGGPITLTHPEITRYFMTVPEAAQLVVQAGAMSSGGDVFVLDMGEPVRIIDLARKMVELSGLTVKDEENEEGDIEIHITGLRPAEKLYEELLIGDNPARTSHPRIMKAREHFMSWAELEVKLQQLDSRARENDVAGIRSLVIELVSGYVSASRIVDWIHLEQISEAGRT
ncbi:polysaccharide biosynthesis protein [Shinella fusca]|uniref:FlaA1/EpsC-like NDP-sugar epimerase n=1 Tax=Shinella fusca TaxID=544480 RepID=A0A7W8DWJ8_9HYPH|nr:nucleoside-diphosphate sugar epimerase/dehydratase [Shinella fusca]MBB5045184.1 FlaA1/EpsC-like NDP-sugar epimerase [Shinella fusca]